jgi:hypothetical protein
LVSTSLYRQGAYTVSFDLNTFLLTGHSIAIGQRESMGNPCMNNYAAGDGRRFWIVGLQAGRHWPPLCRAVGRHWLTDPRYDNGTGPRRQLDRTHRRILTDLCDQSRSGAGAFFEETDSLLGPRSTPSKMSWPTTVHAAAVYVPTMPQR